MEKRKRNARTVLLLAAFFAAAPSLFAGGRGEEAAEGPLVNAEHTLLITAFDVSGLPLARQLMGETVMRSLVNSLEGVTFRVRGEEEIAYFRDYAWANSRAAAARNLQARRNDRDILLFRGEPSWRYRRDLRTVDAAIAALEQQLAEIDALVPNVEERPVFRLSQTNRDGNFPAPPALGEELRFCINNRVDAFLVGSLSEFHGRIHLEARIFTLHSRSFSYEYDVLFSSPDLLGALDEIAGLLVTAVSGTLPAGIIVHASPPDAMVLIDGTLVGRGQMELHTHFPGEVEVEVRADNHVSVTFPLVLNSGELSEVFIDLSPLSLSAFEVAVTDSPGSHVFLGGLFAGETPLALHLPAGQFAYISVETPDGEIGTVVYRNDGIVRGNARFVTDSDTGRTLIVNTMTPIDPEAGRVERARRGFYRAYGTLWIVLPAALLVSGIAGTYINANAHVAATGGFFDDPDARMRIHDNAVRATVARGAAFGVMGVTLGVTFFQIFRYLRAASADATPIIPAAPLVPAPAGYEYPEAGEEAGYVEEP
ncbi:MAG: hypothetical protein FWC64_12265 [Treponema sp.]|nr:hypothetical protein [Treponema sp.]